MRCGYTILRHDKYGVLRRVPCGQCINCRLNRAWSWSVRIMHEAKKYPGKTCFITLTYDDEHLPKDGSLVIADLQNFFKKFRKYYNRKIRYFACGEYGDKTFRPHYHIAFFNVSFDDFDLLPIKCKDGFICMCKAWDKGHVHFGELNEDSANYIAGYILKKVTGKESKKHYEDLGVIPPFCVMSRKPGIGFDYFNAHKEQLHARRYVVAKGIKRGLPRYYKDFLKKRVDDYKKVFEDELARRQKAEKQGKEYWRVLLDEEQQIVDDSVARAKLKRRDKI